MIDEAGARCELVQLTGVRTGCAAPQALNKVDRHRAAADFIREQAVGCEQHAYRVVTVTTDAVPPGQVEIEIGAPLLGQQVKAIRRDMARCCDRTGTVTEVEQDGDLERYSKPQVIEKKNSPRAASYASR
ncbi:MAG: hypothetical protein ACRDRV_00790 [Pseudonocardiaceae bacterium]